ncbi:MAG TPA: hypothetical protein VL588_07360, partial [Bdellovibrionota bacterium]|nr:hypothetical protein [Bdellovibrionota bacterium]
STHRQTLPMGSRRVAADGWDGGMEAPRMRLRLLTLLTFSAVLLVTVLTGCAQFPMLRQDSTRQAHRIPPSESEVYLGMPMEQVRTAWGDPRRIQIAGDPGFGHQRWIYETGAEAGGEGTTGTRVLYFEQGRVAGWETTQGF